MKEAVVAAVFMFELNLFGIFGPRNDILFCHLIFLQSGISNVMYQWYIQCYSYLVKA